MKPYLTSYCVFAASLPLLAATPHPIADAANSLLNPSLEISLFAAEPDVVDPVALTFDEAGRMYVVEMRDYPYGIGPQRKPGGTVRLLEDTNYDGKADKSTIFAENLSFPTSICPWNGGVLVTCPPEIIFLKDTDGDGRADVREVMFKGFTLGVTDSNVNGLRWGLDNRVHGLNGGNSGRIVSLRKPDLSISLADMDFSFDPQTGDFSTTFHSSRGFGLVFDDWGRSLVTYNINHIQERFIAARYLHRFPGFPAIRGTGSISDHEDMARIFPISVAETRPNHPEQSGRFSSAGGMGYLGWDQFGKDLYGSVLVCDVVGNLVHRDLLEQQGPIFRATRSATEQDSEFFASRDNGFRPVGLELGPDGALYLLDMQRDVIEHPDYIPESIRSKIDLRAGEDRGRIYRLKPKNVPSDFINLSSAPISTLIENLSHPIQWRRTTAQRLIVERQLKDAIPSLKQLAISSAKPLGRLHALWSLKGLNALDLGEVEHALADLHPRIREHALLLAEAFLPNAKKISEQICSLANDADARVRFQAALTLGQINAAEVRQALQSILLRDFEYKWTRVAVLSSLPSGAAEILSQLKLKDLERANSGAQLDLIHELADLAVAREGITGFSAVLHSITQSGWTETLQLTALKGLQTGLSRHSGSVPVSSETSAQLEQLTRSPSSAIVGTAWRLARTLGIAETETQRKALDHAMRRARDHSIPESDRSADISLMALGSYSAVKETLFGLLDETQPVAIQQAALSVLKEYNNAEIATILVERWRTFAPSVRASALALLLQRQGFHNALVDALEKGRITVGELNLDLEQRRRLLWFSSPDIKKRAAKLIGDGEYSNRKSIVGEWLAKLPTKGDPATGKSIFEQRCAQCHLVGSTGHRVGPELTGMSHRSVEDLLSNILDPNMAINPAYITYNCETTSGELETGLLQAESPETVTLLQAAEKKIVIPRSNIKHLQSSGLSLMPEGLEAGLTPANLRDLIAFLQQNH
jgi:putative membrane-bound dehydrogenase-like protein